MRGTRHVYGGRRRKRLLQRVERSNKKTTVHTLPCLLKCTAVGCDEIGEHKSSEARDDSFQRTGFPCPCTNRGAKSVYFDSFLSTSTSLDLAKNKFADGGLLMTITL